MANGSTYITRRGLLRAGSLLSATAFAGTVGASDDSTGSIAERGFDDVPDDYWAADQITTLGEVDIVVGYPDGRFRPDRPATRAELATVLTHAFVHDHFAVATVSDIDGHWAEEYIEAATGADLLSGYADGTFRPERRVTRQEALVSIANAPPLPDDPGFEDPEELLDFVDADEVAAWAIDAVALTVSLDVHANDPRATDDADPRLAPTDHATRAEVVNFVYNVLLESPPAGFR